jgi:hypothetical protein
MVHLSLFRIRPDVVYRSLDDEHYLLSGDGAFHTVSDAVGGFVLEFLRDAPPRSLAEIVAAVRQEFDADEADVESDVKTFLDDLLSRNVLEIIAREDDE